jgi:hypothetical protein
MISRPIGIFPAVAMRQPCMATAIQAVPDAKGPTPDSLLHDVDGNALRVELAARRSELEMVKRCRLAP